MWSNCGRLAQRIQWRGWFVFSFFLVILAVAFAVIGPMLEASIHMATVNQITEEMLVANKPLFVTPQKRIDSGLVKLGLDSFASWKRTYSHEDIIVGEDSNHEDMPAMASALTVSKYVDTLLSPSEFWSNSVKSMRYRLSESWGSHWILSRPAVSEPLARLFETLVPLGFQGGFDLDYAQVANHSDKEKMDNHVFALFAAPPGYNYQLHADLVSGTLLTHLEGKKTVWLYPPSQSKYLYFFPKESNWEALSPVDPMKPDLLKFPLFLLARPLVINLKKGDMLFIPCGWAHFVHYGEAAISLATSLYPDWLDNMTDFCSALGKEYVPKSCVDLLKQPKFPVKC